MRGILIVGVIAAGMMAPRGYGQSLFDNASVKSMSLGGIHLYGVSVFGGYSTSAYPGVLGQTLTPGANQLGADINYGSSASLGWQYHRQRWDFSLLYAGTYGGRVRYSDTNAFSQSASLVVSRKLSPKWTFSINGDGSDSTTLQFLFQPSTIGLLSQAPATMDDLEAAMSLGQFSSNQVASTLTGAPLLETPARTLLLGDRVLSYAAQASLLYMHSSRLSFHLASVAAGGQSRLSGNTVAQPNFAMPRSIGVNAGMGMSYMLSPRTQVGLDATGYHTTNRFQNANISSASASLGRKMGIHWFLSAHGGGSFTQLTSQTYGAPKMRQLIGGGSIGFRTYQHSLLGSYDRTSQDTYGLAIGTTTMLTAAWNWHHPGSPWSVFTSYTQQQVRNTGYISLTGWEASSGVERMLSSQVRMSAQYVYLSNSAEYLGSITNLAIHSIRLSLSWAPQATAH